VTAFNIVRCRVKPGNEQRLGVTDPASGEVVVRLAAPRAAKKRKR
jgi:hypothetical protein